MASSLERLLTEEGFKGRKGKTGLGASLRSRALSMPLSMPHLCREQGHIVSASEARARTERTRSEITRSRQRNEFATSQRTRGRRPRDNLVKGESSSDTRERNLKTAENFEGGASKPQVTSKDFHGIDAFDHGRRHSDVHEGERFKDIFSNEVEENERNTKYSQFEKEKYRDKYRRNSDKHLSGHMGFSDSSRQSLKEPATSYSIFNRSSHHNRSSEDIGSGWNLGDKQTFAEPALDEVAIQAIVSILSGYARRFIKDKDFRTVHRQNCFSSLGLTNLEEGNKIDSTVIANLEEAMETVEAVVEEFGSPKELKKASLQLTVITGLNSSELQNKFTSGISNSKLSACAHLYLSVVYKLKKKDRISAKHLLQVFCDSPFEARTILAPDLWDHVVLPHLSPLRVWYNQEKEAIPDTSSRTRKLKLLEKFYSEILDLGTYQFATYYKDWLAEGVEAPNIPSIQIPSESLWDVSQEGLHGHSSERASPIRPILPQIISKKLYQEGGEQEARNLNNRITSFESLPEVEDKQLVSYSIEMYAGQHIEQDPSNNGKDYTSHHAEGLPLAAEKEIMLHKMNALVMDIKNEINSTSMWDKAPGNTHKLHALSHTKAIELALNKLAESVFQLQQTGDSVDLISTHSLHSSNMPMSVYTTDPCNKISRAEDENHGYFEKGSFFSSIPKDFICPLTGQLFEDPVTIETGQTFERTAIGDWVDQGNRTCPITGKLLECLVVPTTNLVLMHVIDGWKSQNCRKLLDFASQIAGNSVKHGFKSKDEAAVTILKQLLTVLSKEERTKYAKNLMSLGGLQFLIQRFELGNLEEKACLAGLLSCCIEADGGCRNYIARKIKKPCLLELLHCKHIKPRTNAVSLLIELICLNRRIEVTSFLSGLQTEGIISAMHVLLVYLQSSSTEHKPLVSVLLLHFDLLIEPRKYSIYREEAVDSVTMALDCCLTSEKIRAQCCRALLILGGTFSFSGEVVIVDWLLMKAGFDCGCEINSFDNENGVQVDENIQLDEEEKAREEWLKKLTISLLGSGKKAFMEAISKCLASGNKDLVRACLTTVTWLSCALASLSDAEFLLSAFSILIPQLKETLENGKRIEHRVLACLSLLNFSKVSECRVLLTMIREEIVAPLQSLAQVTWTAKKLYTTLSGENL